VILVRVAELERDEEKEEEHRKEEKEHHKHLEELVLLDRKMQAGVSRPLPPRAPPVVETTSTMRRHLKLIDPTLVHNQRGYAPPHRYLESWHRLLDQHVAAGRLRPSSSPFSSPVFIIPKKYPTELPRWVNDYCKLNTYKDRMPLLVLDEVLQSCMHGRAPAATLLLQGAKSE
jgi:hypothetical protein